MKYEILPFETAHVDAASTLLAERHQRNRSCQPLLRQPFGRHEAKQAIEATLAKAMTSGVVAIRDGEVVAYLIGEMVLDQLWGRSAWVRMPGMAVAAGESAEIIRDLYAVLGERWLNYGIFFHFAVAPVSDPDLIDAWFRLSFGVEQMYALADLHDVDLSDRPVPTGLEIRRIGPGDREHLERLSTVTWHHQIQAPCWGIHLPERQAQHRRDYGDLIDDDEGIVWLALWEGEPVGVQGYWPMPGTPDDMLAGTDTIELACAATVEAMRGRGINTALTRHGMAHARELGYRYCQTDWRSTNLLSSRFWPRQGFVPVSYRLVRRVDARITWAQGENRV